MDIQQASIALFLPDLAGGGAERVMVTLANEFSKQVGKVTLILANSNEMKYADELSEKVHLKIFNRSRTITALPDLVLYLRRYQPDALLTTLNHVNCIASLAVMLANTRTALYVRHDLAPEPCPLFLKQPKLYAYHQLVQWAYNRAQGVISLSTDMTLHLQTHYSLSVPVHTIYNPLPLQQLAHLAEETMLPTPPWTDNGPMFLAVGRLRAQKDLRTLLLAFAALPGIYKAKLAILGEGSERVALEQLVQELGIANQVWLPGYVSNPYAFMKRATAYVLCSEREGLPNSLIQALACGAPCIATDCPTGPREILADGERGILIAVGDVAALTDALETTLKTKEPHTLRPPVQTTGFIEKYDTENISQRYLAVLLGEQRIRVCS